jgi:uncharacterized protein
LQAGAANSWHVEGDPKAITQEIQFTNGDVHLAGTLYLPEHGDHLPAVVALHGASDATRDAALYRHLRECLPGLGIAVLIYDRRGSGASSGTLKGIYHGTLADDAIAARNAIASLPKIDSARIGFWGLSQGGWLAVLAAERSKNAAFVISVSAPLTTPERQMEFATTNLLTVRGYSRKDVEQMLETRKAWFGYLNGATPRTAALEALRRAEALVQPRIYAESITAYDRSSAQLRAEGAGLRSGRSSSPSEGSFAFYLRRLGSMDSGRAVGKPAPSWRMNSRTFAAW